MDHELRSPWRGWDCAEAFGFALGVSPLFRYITSSRILLQNHLQILLWNSWALHMEHSWLAHSFYIFPLKLTGIWEVKQVFHPRLHWNAFQWRPRSVCNCPPSLYENSTRSQDVSEDRNPELSSPTLFPRYPLLTVWCVSMDSVSNAFIFNFLLWKYSNIHKSRNSIMKSNVLITQVQQATLTTHWNTFASQCI